MASDLVLLRWFVTRPGRPPYRAAEEIIRDAIAPAVAALGAIAALESLYVSKQCGREVWLTAFLPNGSRVAAINAVEPHLHSVCFRTGHIDDPTKDRILGQSCKAYRLCLHAMTHIGLDLHASHLAVRQRELVAIGCVKRSDRGRLEPLLLLHSPTYRAIVDRDAFWQSFGSSCAGQSACGHWLYNVVLGLDWFEGQAEPAVLHELGL